MWREQIVSSQLADSVGSVAVRRDTGPPRSLSSAELAAVFETLRPAVRLRDEPMLALMCRLGLRACEVASLVLEDVEWREGLLAIAGKGQRRETMPLPVDVGALLAGYVQLGRPVGTPHRQVFLSLIAPHRPLLAASVSDVAARALAAAGVPGCGAAHRFRHTAGCSVLAAGGGLVEAGQLLRHSSAAATAVYARSDLGALAVLARPWPRGALR
jgi:integrase